MAGWARRSLKKLFTARAAGARPTDIVLWWEYRRLPYNIVVGAAGLLTTTVMLATAFTCERSGGAPIGLPDPPFLVPVGIIAFGVLANVCYTGGWIAELLVRALEGTDAPDFGPVMFGLGTLFSVVLAFVPGVAAVLVAALTLCRGF